MFSCRCTGQAGRILTGISGKGKQDDFLIKRMNSKFSGGGLKMYGMSASIKERMTEE